MKHDKMMKRNDDPLTYSPVSSRHAVFPLSRICCTAFAPGDTTVLTWGCAMGSTLVQLLAKLFSAGPRSWMVVLGLGVSVKDAGDGFVAHIKDMSALNGLPGRISFS